MSLGSWSFLQIAWGKYVTHQVFSFDPIPQIQVLSAAAASIQRGASGSHLHLRDRGLLDGKTLLPWLVDRKLWTCPTPDGDCFED